ncbi:hypothetical protein [Streptomyces platensis]
MPLTTSGKIYRKRLPAVLLEAGGPAGSMPPWAVQVWGSLDT